MSNEFSIEGPTGYTTFYAVLHHPTDATKTYNTTSHSYETTDSAHWADYDFPMTEVDSSGTYVADFPASHVTDVAPYPYTVRVKVGGGVSSSDPIYGTGVVGWTGVFDDAGQVTTVAKVKVANGWADTTDHDAEIEQLLPAVTAGIAKYLRRPHLLAADVDEVRSGPGGDWVRAYDVPVNSITSVTFNYQDRGEATVAGDQFVFDADTGVIKFKPLATIKYGFGCGFRSLRLVYNAGWQVAPDDVQAAAALVVRTLIELGDEDRLVTETSEGNRKKKYGQVFVQATEGRFGDPLWGQVVSLLDPYKVVRYC